MATRKRYAQVGVGHRSWMYSEAMVERFRNQCEVVALCDTNPGRLRVRADWMSERGAAVKCYPADEFERMIAETRPDTVIVTTMDSTHDAYICRALEMGCDVITEKPMTTDEQKCQRILDAQKRSGRKCTVAFNYRYAMPRTQVKELLMSGVIGSAVAVDFHWLLDTVHGADYFRRWHRQKRNSGGLLVHKATHHFDLVNWWLATVPQTVYATGARNFYRPETAARYGFVQRGERCRGCAEADRCPFYLDLGEYPDLKSLYLENEEYDGYFRDRCVFSDQIDIEDTMHVNVRYRSGALMSYSLHAFMPWEGYVVTFNGTQGRLEHVCQESVYISGDGSVPGELVSGGTRIKVFPHFQPGYEVEIRQSGGGHGGADPLLLKDLFDPDPSQDPVQRAADQRSGAWSILTGIAANRSIQRGQPVHIEELVRELDEPDYSPMPDPCAPVDPGVFKRAKASRVKS